MMSTATKTITKKRSTTIITPITNPPISPEEMEFWEVIFWTETDGGVVFSTGGIAVVVVVIFSTGGIVVVVSSAGGTAVVVVVVVSTGGMDVVVVVVTTAQSGASGLSREVEQDGSMW